MKLTFGSKNGGHTDGLTCLVELENSCLASGSDDKSIKIDEYRVMLNSQSETMKWVLDDNGYLTVPKEFYKHN